MAILASDILDSVSLTLLDEDNISYPSSELIGYLNEGLRATAMVKHDFYVTTGSWSMVAGVTQTAPATAVAVIDVEANVASGRAVTLVDLELLDESNRFWRAGTSQGDVVHYAADPRNPLKIKVYPPNDGTGAVTAVYGAVPTAVTAAGDTLGVSEMYQHALTNFVLAKAYAKNTKHQDLVKSAAARDAWRVDLGLKSQTQVAVAPRVSSQPGV